MKLHQAKSLLATLERIESAMATILQDILVPNGYALENAPDEGEQECICRINTDDLEKSRLPCSILPEVPFGAIARELPVRDVVVLVRFTIWCLFPMVDEKKL